MNPSIPHLFNRELYLARQQKARASQAPLLVYVAEDLELRLSVINHQFANVLLIAQQPVFFEGALRANLRCDKIVGLRPLAGDALNLEPATYDAVFSILDLHCVNDVPGYLAQLSASLKPDGLLMLCCFAEDTLVELRRAWLAAESDVSGGATPRLAPMIALREMGGLLQRAGLALPVADNDHANVRYASPLALLREIKTFGFANPVFDRTKNFTTKRLLGAVLQHYESENSDPDGKVRASLDLTWALGWKPHPSQQQPKKPGSATHLLSEALKSV